MNPCMFSKGGNLTSTLYLLYIVHLMSLLILSHVLSAKRNNMMAILISEQLSSTQFANTCTCLRALFLHHLRANTLFTLINPYFLKSDFKCIHVYMYINWFICLWIMRLWLNCTGLELKRYNHYSCTNVRNHVIKYVYLPVYMLFLW